MSRVNHLKLDKKATRGAMFAFLPGDPDRVLKIAQGFDPDSQEIARHREFRTLLGNLKGEPVLVTSTGTGGFPRPSRWRNWPNWGCGSSCG